MIQVLYRVRSQTWTVSTTPALLTTRYVPFPLLSIIVTLKSSSSSNRCPASCSKSSTFCCRQESHCEAATRFGHTDPGVAIDKLVCEYMQLGGINLAVSYYQHHQILARCRRILYILKLQSNCFAISLVSASSWLWQDNIDSASRQNGAGQSRYRVQCNDKTMCQLVVAMSLSCLDPGYRPSAHGIEIPQPHHQCRRSK
jgi:hypothetical protein